MPGGREETVDDSEILQIFLENEDPVLFTGEVADEIGFSNQGTLPRLHNLADKGFLKSKDGGRSIVWWLTDEGQDFLAGELDEDDLPEP
jgi:predicted transcriptional regulator